MLKNGFHLGEWQAVHDICFGQPAFAGDVGTEAEVLELRDVVRVGIDDATDAFPFREGPEAPVHVEAASISVEFNPCSCACGSVDHARDIECVSLSREQEPTGEMAEHGDVGIFDGADDSFCHRRFAHFEGVMNRCYDVVELGEDVVGVVEGTVFEDVAFDAGEDSKIGAEFGVELVDGLDLFEELGFGKAARLDGASGVV